MRIGRWLKNEFLMGQTVFSSLFLVIGILIQIIAFSLSDDTVVSLVCGILGIITVVLCCLRKISQFVFGIIQEILYLYLTIVEKLYGEAVENVFYIATNAIGLFMWLRCYKVSEDEGNKVDTLKLNRKGWGIVGLIFLVGCTTSYLVLSKTDDSQPFMDTISTIPAFIAQVLMVMRYREQWVFWVIVNIGSIVMWAIAGNVCMVMLFVFWMINCVYGYYKWSAATSTRQQDYETTRQQV